MPTRYGLDQLIVGLKIGILNQDRLSRMPKWVIGLEGRFAVGKPMTFSRDTVDADPAGNHRVGRGTHELGVDRPVAPLPLPRPVLHRVVVPGHPRQRLRVQELRLDAGPREPAVQRRRVVRHRDRAVRAQGQGQKVALNLRGLAMLKYGGRGYSEAWELFADSPALVGTYQPGQANLECSRADVDSVVQYAKDNPQDGDPLANSGAPQGCQRFNGITNIQDFATFGLNIALHAHLSRYAMLMIGTTLTTDTRHLITAASRGKAQLDEAPISRRGPGRGWLGSPASETLGSHHGAEPRRTGANPGATPGRSPVPARFARRA